MGDNFFIWLFEQLSQLFNPLTLFLKDFLLSAREFWSNITLTELCLLVIIYYLIQLLNKIIANTNDIKEDLKELNERSRHNSSIKRRNDRDLEP